MNVFMGGSDMSDDVITGIKSLSAIVTKVDITPSDFLTFKR